MEAILKEVEQQMKAEIGEDELNPEQLNMMRQKYGLMTPQITDSEKRLLKRWEHKYGRN